MSSRRKVSAQARLGVDIKKNKSFLFKLTYEPIKQQKCRLEVASLLQRKLVIRILHRIAIGEIPVGHSHFQALKKARKVSTLDELGEKPFFFELLQSDQKKQIKYIKQFLPLLNGLLHRLFYLHPNNLITKGLD